MNDALATLTTPTISVVVIVLNGSDIGPCLSAHPTELTPGRYEIIVVDNGSTGGTVELLKQHGQVVMN
jgi:glycosyltransferase involved in cell wall biosynthesis